MRTLQIVAIAGAVGAVGGGMGALALMGGNGGWPRQSSGVAAPAPATAFNAGLDARAAAPQAGVKSQVQNEARVGVAPSNGTPQPRSAATGPLPSSVATKPAATPEAAHQAGQLAMQGLYNRVDTGEHNWQNSWRRRAARLRSRHYESQHAGRQRQLAPSETPVPREGNWGGGGFFGFGND